VALVSTQRARKETDQDGFTLIELVMALAISAFAFLALATMLAGTLRALSVGKTRAQGNEVATQGIEDLQRLDFNDLGVCATGAGGSDPAPVVPSSLTSFTSVALPNCSGSVVYEQPCAPPAGNLTTFAVPKQTYTCVRNKITYTVNRYIMWADSPQNTAKRLAVYVSWTDQAGLHQVAQESSLRSPNAASVIGLSPPQFVNVSASPANIAIEADGSPDTAIALSANTNGLTASDSVYATLYTLTTQPDLSILPLPTEFVLTSADGAQWSTTIREGALP
jgi:prepilin-type N-terminal cleavage/methylation domain-containing protein